LRTLWVVLAAVLSLAPPEALAAAQRNGPLPASLVPADNWWRTDVSAAPLDPGSTAFISFVGTTRGLHPDFGGSPGTCLAYGFPYVTVGATQPKQAVQFDYADECDGVDPATGVGIPFYPIPDQARNECYWIEGGAAGGSGAGGDRHMLILDTDDGLLYELYALAWDGARWTAGSGARLDLKTSDRRPETWTSADAAGLAILPGLVRYDEAQGAAEITHAFRVTVRASNGYVFPASHGAGSTAGALPMGARLRLKASKDISGFTPEMQRVFRAMKKYGLVVADNGSDMYVSGVFDTRWNSDVLNPAFGALKAGDFEVIRLGWQPPAASPRVQSFAATPAVTRAGSCSTLSWATLGGAVTTLDGGTVGAVDSASVCPAATTTYSLAVTNGSTPATRKATVQVVAGVAGMTAPFGSLDVPADGTGGVTGAIPVTGWALDDIEVTNVGVYRDPLAGESTSPNGKVYLGDAVFVPGARGDVEGAYANFPRANRAGWGLQLLTNFLPGGGNGSFRLHAFAYDADAHATLLGSKRITCTNASAAVPFGTIDTPGQGQTVSGTVVNFGWALTPPPASIPVDGSTLWVFVDGTPLGHPVYNQYRSDISTLFPGYANSTGAVGYYRLDTSALANGLHTIAWSVTDSLGRVAGIGSRYFWVQN
jgi:hypothetical protein